MLSLYIVKFSCFFSDVSDEYKNVYNMDYIDVQKGKVKYLKSLK